MMMSPQSADTAGESLASLIARFNEDEAKIKLGGGKEAIQRQHAKKRLTSRERIQRLIDPDAGFFELGLWTGWQMYEEWGGAPAAGVVCGIGNVGGRRHMII